MINSDRSAAPKKLYTISNEQMLHFISELPALKDNNKHTEFSLQVRTVNEVISTEAGTALSSDVVGKLDIHFSYDFVNDRWFLNDNKIEVIDRNRY